MNLPYTIKRLERADIPLIVQAFADAGWPKSPCLFEHYCLEQDEHRGFAWIAYSNGACAGYVTLQKGSKYPYFKEIGMPEIMDLNVLPEYRRQGIGSALLDHAEKTALNKGYESVGLGMGLYGGYGSAQRLYIKRGYIPDGKGITYNYSYAQPGTVVQVDDELALWLIKKLA